LTERDVRGSQSAHLLLLMMMMIMMMMIGLALEKHLLVPGKQSAVVALAQATGICAAAAALRWRGSDFSQFSRAYFHLRQS
jgi:hypothetical protein